MLCSYKNVVLITSPDSSKIVQQLDDMSIVVVGAQFASDDVSERMGKQSFSIQDTVDLSCCGQLSETFCRENEHFDAERM